MHGLHVAGPGDLPVVAALERACFGAADGVFSCRQLRALLANPNAYWLLGANGQAMACWLRAHNGRARWARLYSLAVHPERRGEGWGDRLLEAGFAWMRANGLETCRAEVKLDNLAARGLYARLGFREVGILRDYYGMGLSGVRLMVRLADRAKPRHAA